MTAFWAATPVSFSSPLPPPEVERRLKAVIADRDRRPRIVGSVASGRVVVRVRPFDYRADLHPRLRADISAAPGGSVLHGRIATARWALWAFGCFIAFLAAVALFLLAAALAPGLDSRARDPWHGFVLFSGLTLFAICYTGVLLWVARNDRAILVEFVRRTVEA